MGTSVQVKGSETPEKTRKIIVDELRDDLEDWLSSKQNRIWRPPIELTEKDGEFVLTAIVAGAEPKNVEVLVAPDIMLVKAELRPNHLSKSGTSHPGEVAHGKLSRAVLFPRAINADNVHAEIKDGLLTVKAQIADHSNKGRPAVRHAADGIIRFGETREGVDCRAGTESAI